MEYVYVVVIDEVYEYESVRLATEVFRKYEDAKAEFDSCVEDARAEYLEEEWEEGAGTDFFELYPEGLYAQSHYAVYLRKIEVQ